jgi:hypothetical protein
MAVEGLSRSKGTYTSSTKMGNRSKTTKGVRFLTNKLRVAMPLETCDMQFFKTICCTSWNQSSPAGTCLPVVGRQNSKLSITGR